MLYFKSNIMVILVLLAILVNNSCFAQSPIILKKGMLNSNANTYQAVGKTFYFKITGATNVKQLWKTDGTVIGTTMVKDSFSYDIESLVNINNTLYFLARSTFNTASPLALWKSDGTDVGTSIVKIFPKLASVGFVTVINNMGYFKVDNSLWKTDGTDAGTVEVKGIASTIQTQFYPVTNGIVFLSTSATGYQSIWKTDGSAAGTTMLKDSVARPAAGQVASSFTVVNGNLFFWVANQGKLWKTDGTVSGTIHLATIANVSGLTAHNNALYFSVFSISPLGYYLWKSDGTIAGTANIPGFTAVRSLISMGGSLFLGGKTLHDFEPYKSDGTFAGSTLLKDINAGATASNPQYLTKVMDQICFQANDGVYGTQIWKSDGTPNGTVMAYAVTDTISALSTVYMIPFNESLLFLHKDDLYIIQIDSKPGSIAKSTNHSAYSFAYPNPTNSMLTITLPETVEQVKLSVLNSSGQKVFAKHIVESNETIDVSRLSKGVYFIQMESDYGFYYQKIMIE